MNGFFADIEKVKKENAAFDRLTAAGVLIDGIAPDGQKIVTLEQIKAQSPENCELLAVCNNGKQYPATYSAKLKTVFFTIPRGAEILGYIGA